MRKWNFNGWQRLWAASGILYAIFIMIITLSIFPFELTPVNRCLDPQFPMYGNPFCDLIFADGESNLKSYPAYEAQLLEKQSNILRKNQLKILGTSLLYWLGPMLLLYLIGVLAAWVIRGFKNNHKNGSH